MSVSYIRLCKELLLFRTLCTVKSYLYFVFKFTCDLATENIKKMWLVRNLFSVYNEQCYITQSYIPSTVFILCINILSGKYVSLKYQQA